MPSDQQRESDGGISRRRLLTRGAIAGGLVWAAPVIRTTAAYATTANGTERPCHDFFMVVIDPDGKVRPQPHDLYRASVPVAIQHWFLDNPDVTVQFPAVPPLLTQAGASAWAVLLPEVTGPNASGRQCRMVIGWGEKNHHYAEGYVDPNPPLAAEVGRRLIFPCPDAGHDGNGGDHHGDGTDGHRNESDQTVAPTSDTTAGTATADAVVSPDAAAGPDAGASPDAVVSPDASVSPDATASAAVAPSTTTTTTTTTTPIASAGAGVATGTIGSDGSSSSGQVSSDGSPSPTVSSDGSPSKSPLHPHGPDTCINHVFLIYCCPR